MKIMRALLVICIFIGLGLLLIFLGLPKLQGAPATKIERVEIKPPDSNSAILQEKDGLKLNRTVPNLILHFLDDSSQELSFYKQNVIIMQFFTTNCENCLKQIKELEILDQTITDNLVIFLIHRADQEEISPQEISALSLSLPIIIDKSGLYPIIFGEENSPMARLVIDKNEKVRFLDFTFESAANLQKKISSYL